MDRRQHRDGRPSGRENAGVDLVLRCPCGSRYLPPALTGRPRRSCGPRRRELARQEARRGRTASRREAWGAALGIELVSEADLVTLIVTEEDLAAMVPSEEDLSRWLTT